MIDASFTGSGTNSSLDCGHRRRATYAAASLPVLAFTAGTGLAQDSPTDALQEVAVSDFGLDITVHGAPRTYGVSVGYRLE